MIDWNEAFDNSGHIENSEQFPRKWLDAAADFRNTTNAQYITLRYGRHEREQIDLFIPPDSTSGKAAGSGTSNSPVGLAVFVHGGYWLKTGREYWSHLAGGALANGWAVALPGYVLAPEARLSGITVQIAQAIESAAVKVDGPIRLAGHSAGGHLVARMMCQDSHLSLSVRERIAHVMSISGVHDLRPLMLTDMNAQLKLDETEARAESPALQHPLTAPQDMPPITTWVGAQERPEFLRQSRLLSEAWQAHGVTVATIYDSNHDHFSVIDGLRSRDAEITRHWLEFGR